MVTLPDCGLETRAPGPGSGDARRAGPRRPPGGRRSALPRAHPDRSRRTKSGFPCAWLVAIAAAVLAAGCRGPESPVVREVERKQWTHPGVAHEAHVSDPALAVLGTEPLLAVLRGHGGRQHVFVHAPGAGEPVRVDPDDVVPAPAHQPPGLAVAPNGSVLVSWIARRPEAAGDPFAADLRLSRSVDGGRRFDAPLRVHEDVPGARGFDGLAIASDGAAVVAWIDNHGGPASYAARIVDGARVESESRIDDDTCPCCRVAVATGPDGAVAIALRKVFPGNVRDFVLARSADGGRRFAGPARVHEDDWAIEACPHRGGALALDGSGGAALAWYTEGSDRRPQLRFARAEPGAPFGTPISLHDDAKTVPDRVSLALAPDGRGLVVWEAFTPARRAILARATLDGGRHFGPATTLSTAVKAMGPAVAVAGDGSLWFAWNEERFPSLHTVLLRLEIEEAGQRTGTSK